MNYKEIPYVNKKCSEIIYGTACSPYLDGEYADEVFEGIFSLGINFIDTARNYKLAEKSVGHWLEKYGHRDEIVLLTKCAHPEDGHKRVSEKDIRDDYAVSREYLHTDYFDIYLLHRDDPDVPAGEVVEIMNALYSEGKIGAFGGSNWTYQRIEEANEYAYAHNLIPFSVSSPNFSLAHQAGDPWGWGTVTITGDENKEAREWYRNNQMPVVAYSSLGRGIFSGRIKSTDFERASQLLDEPAMKGYGYKENFEKLAKCEELAFKKGCSVSQIALSWLYRQQINVFAVISTKSPLRMQENIDAISIELTADELDYLSN